MLKKKLTQYKSTKMLKWKGKREALLRKYDITQARGLEWQALVTPVLERWKQEDSWDSLASQFSKCVISGTQWRLRLLCDEITKYWSTLALILIILSVRIFY